MAREIKITDDVAKLPLRTARRLFERAYLQRVLERHGDSVARAAGAANFHNWGWHLNLLLMYE